ncbi:MAG: hypothetical protein M1831_003591 [Alyxoria varia]|nr:MAG: hypothetical protein M1831_003591 [Alyxoria varia]
MLQPLLTTSTSLTSPSTNSPKPNEDNTPTTTSSAQSFPTQTSRTSRTSTRTSSSGRTSPLKDRRRAFRLSNDSTTTRRPKSVTTARNKLLHIWGLSSKDSGRSNHKPVTPADISSPIGEEENSWTPTSPASANYSSQRDVPIELTDLSRPQSLAATNTNTSTNGPPVAPLRSSRRATRPHSVATFSTPITATKGNNNNRPTSLISTHYTPNPLSARSSRAYTAPSNGPSRPQSYASPTSRPTSLVSTYYKPNPLSARSSRVYAARTTNSRPTSLVSEHYTLNPLSARSLRAHQARTNTDSRPTSVVSRTTDRPTSLVSNHYTPNPLSARSSRAYTQLPSDPAAVSSVRSSRAYSNEIPSALEQLEGLDSVLASGTQTQQSRQSHTEPQTPQVQPHRSQRQEAHVQGNGKATAPSKSRSTAETIRARTARSKATATQMLKRLVSVFQRKVNGQKHRHQRQQQTQAQAPAHQRSGSTSATAVPTAGGSTFVTTAGPTSTTPAGATTAEPTSTTPAGATTAEPTSSTQAAATTTATIESPATPPELELPEHTAKPWRPTSTYNKTPIPTPGAASEETSPASPGFPAPTLTNNDAPPDSATNNDAHTNAPTTATNAPPDSRTTAAMTQPRTTMHRLYAPSKSGPLSLSTSTPRPTQADLQPHEVAVKIKAVALNPLDWKQLASGVMVEEWPAVLGIDGSGVVEGVCGGDGGTTTEGKFKPGDEVFGLFGHGNRAAAFQEVAVVPEWHLCRKPESLGWEECASLAICYLTASSAINANLKIPLPFTPATNDAPTPPHSVLVLGGSSGVGSSAIQLLRHSLGPSIPIIATSSPQHHTRLTQDLGASHAFSQSSATLVEDIKAATPGGKGVDVIIDTVGAAAKGQEGIWDVLDEDGRREFSEVFTGPQAQVPEGVEKKSAYGRMVFGEPGGKENGMDVLADMVEEGVFKVPLELESVGGGFEGIAGGLEKLKMGVSGKKLVVSVS